jgi:nitrous oxide reductase accessory protein NosL
MKKIVASILAIGLLASCQNEELFVPTPTAVNEKLQIVGNMGIRVETPFVKDEVSMNVKAETAGKYIVKILNIENKSVSKEEVDIKAGNNVLKIYANALPSSAYRIALFDMEGNALGIADFNKL